MSLRQFEMSVLNALYIVTLDTTNGVLNIYYTLSCLVTQTVRSVVVNNFTQKAGREQTNLHLARD